MEPTTPKRIKLTDDIGNAKKGAIFVRGLHGVPDWGFWKENGHSPEDFYWREGSSKADNSFLFKNWIWGKDESEEWNYAEAV